MVISLRGSFRKLKSFEQFNIIISLIALCVIGSFLSPIFLSPKNLMNVLRAASLVALTGIGMVLIILTGEIDLSVGSVQAIVGLVTVSVMNVTGNFYISLVVALATGLLIGWVNGFLITRAGINSLIATLGTMAILRGIAYVSTQAVSIQSFHTEFSDFGGGYWWIFPKPLVLAFVLIAVVQVVIDKTIFGRHVYAVGGNDKAAELTGINVNRVKRRVFLISGTLTALSAFILASRLNSGQPNAGIGFEFQVIAAVILGGISLKGGKGTLSGAMVGVLILSVLSNILILLNVSPFYHEIARGVVILLAVYLDARKLKNQKINYKRNSLVLDENQPAEKLDGTGSR